MSRGQTNTLFNAREEGRAHKLSYVWICAGTTCTHSSRYIWCYWRTLRDCSRWLKNPDPYLMVRVLATPLSDDDDANDEGGQKCHADEGQRQVHGAAALLSVHAHLSHRETLKKRKVVKRMS